MRHKDELDELIRRGANGPDGELADLFVAMRSAGQALPPVPSRALASVLLGATPIDLLTPEDLARSPRPAQAGSGGWLAGRLAALAPATRYLLAGSIAVAAVTVSVAVNELTEDRLRVNIVTPATPTSDATTTEAPTSEATTSEATTPAPSSLATTSTSSSQSPTSRSDRSQPGRSASSTRSRDRSDTSTRSSSSSPRSTSREASPTSRSSSETETETLEPTGEESTFEGTSSGKRSAGSNGDTSAE